MQLKDAPAGPTGCLENPLTCYLFAIGKVIACLL